MAERRDILQGSPAWDELRRHGIPEQVQPVELRRYLHLWANVLGPVVEGVNDALEDAKEAKEDAAGVKRLLTAALVSTLSLTIAIIIDMVKGGLLG